MTLFNFGTSNCTNVKEIPEKVQTKESEDILFCPLAIEVSEETSFYHLKFYNLV